MPCKHRPAAEVGFVPEAEVSVFPEAIDVGRRQQRGDLKELVGERQSAHASVPSTMVDVHCDVLMTDSRNVPRPYCTLC